MYFLVSPSPGLAQSATNAGTQAQPASLAATKEEVAALRQEVAELKAIVRDLIQASGKSVPAEFITGPAISAPEQRTQPVSVSTLAVPIPPHTAFRNDSDPLPQKSESIPQPAFGWNGDHFFLTSSDGNFNIMPVGYLNANYVFYKGDGAPPDTFAIRRARFGLQGTYGNKIDYVFLFESATSISIRDAYLDFKPWASFKIMGGQFRVPFTDEADTPDTNFEFIDRSIISVLSPNAGPGGFRAPGIDAHGDLFGGRVQYWAGVFNGQGILESSTTNEPEVTGRIRLTPWRRSAISGLKGLHIGGSFDHGRSKALANELSFSGVMSDNSYTFFPQFRINGGIQRYNGFFSWFKGPLGVRGEYTQILEKRTGIGSIVSSDLGFNSLPGIVGRGAYATVSYLLTGEPEPEYSIPRVKHPVIGPNSPGEMGGPGLGAWQVKFRYSWLEGKAPGATCDSSTIPACPLTPVVVPAYSDHTNQFSAGINWYLNYWVLAKSDFNLDQLKNPSVQGILPRNYYVFSEGLQFRF